MEVDGDGVVFDGDPYWNIVFSPSCTLCSRFQDYTKKICEAFPDGIPPEIWIGNHKHTEPYPGDNGLQFQKTKSEKEQQSRPED